MQIRDEEEAKRDNLERVSEGQDFEERIQLVIYVPFS